LSLENLNLASNGRPLLPIFALYPAINSDQTLGFARASIQRDLLAICCSQDGDEKVAPDKVLLNASKLTRTNVSFIEAVRITTHQKRM
jgi:hypothetical protein